MTTSYDIPAKWLEHYYVVKKSQFITRVHHASSRHEAMEHLARAKKDYPDARHHCWAYVLGSPKQPSSQAFNDDGEPNGTAGKPILNVLNHAPLGDVMVIVIRYFGGIRLGASGLVRAYSNATNEAINKTDRELKSHHQHYCLIMPFQQENLSRHYLKQCEAAILQTDYQEQILMHIALKAEHQKQTEDFCMANGIQMVDDTV